jgi:hypothetical protein
LRKYPLPLNSGKECIILEGFGDKICKMIDERLKNYLADGGILLHDTDEFEFADDDNDEKQPESVSCGLSNNNRSTDRSASNCVNISEENDSDDSVLASIEANMPNENFLKTKNKAKANNTKAKSNKKHSGEISPKNDLNQTSDSSMSNKRANKKPNKKTNKNYVPEFRSGAYALLVTLYDNEKVILFIYK